MYLIALSYFFYVKYWLGFEPFTENLIKTILFSYFTICFDFLAQKQRMTYNEILEHLYDLNLDCLSENEFDDYEDEVADKAWTLPSTNRHVEQVSSSDKDEISFDQNIPRKQCEIGTILYWYPFTIHACIGPILCDNRLHTVWILAQYRIYGVPNIETIQC